MDKPYWESKELIVAAISLTAAIVQQIYGWVIPPDIQGYATVVVLAIIRAVWTKGNVTLSRPAVVIDAVTGADAGMQAPESK